MFPPGIESGTFRVLGECDNQNTTETWELSFPIYKFENNQTSVLAIRYCLHLTQRETKFRGHGIHLTLQ